jgi:pyruvate dehydrogenase E1 component
VRRAGIARRDLARRREQLDNLIFVINCNLQRLDGPVRGNGKIIQELEGVFRGAGWNVIKVVGARPGTSSSRRTRQGILLRRMEECVDGQYQDFKSKDGAYVREHFFNTPELKALVADLSDEQVWKSESRRPRSVQGLCRVRGGGEAQRAADGDLAKTVKGYGMGESGEGQMISHQAKKMTQDALKQFRDRFDIPCPTTRSPSCRSSRFPRTVRSGSTCRASRRARRLPAAAAPRSRVALPAPRSPNFERLLQELGRARDLDDDGFRADARHAGARQGDRQARRADRRRRIAHVRAWKGMFRQLGIYSSVGQLYKPQEADQLMYYREDKAGQVLQEGINEAGAMSSWIAAATSYSTERPADDPVLHLLLDVRLAARRRSRLARRRHAGARLPVEANGRGAQRSTAKGLQHVDGHSHILASTIPTAFPTIHVRVRSDRDRPRRHPADVRGAAGRLLLPHADETRTTRIRRCPKAPSKGSSKGSIC